MMQIIDRKTIAIPGPAADADPKLIAAATARADAVVRALDLPEHVRGTVEAQIAAQLTPALLDAAYEGAIKAISDSPGVVAEAAGLAQSAAGLVRSGTEEAVHRLPLSGFSFFVRGSNRRIGWVAAAEDGSMPPHTEEEIRDRLGFLADETAAAAGYSVLNRGSNGRVGAGSVMSDGSWAPPSVADMRRQLGVRTLFGVGDSITEGSSAGGANHIRAAASQAGLAAVLNAWPGAPANTISFRAGGFALKLSFAGGQIPAGSAPVTVEVDAKSGWYSGTVAAYHVYPVVLDCGLTGTLSRDPSTGVWSWVRDPGSPYVIQETVAVSGPVGARCTSHLSVIRDSGTHMILWQGRNGVRDTASHAEILLRDQQLAAMATGRYYAYSILPMHSETPGTSRRDAVDALNAARAALHGAAYRDIASWLIDEGLNAVGITPTAADNADRANRVIPRSLLGDAADLDNGVHANAAGVHAITIYHLAQLTADGLI